MKKIAIMQPYLFPYIGYFQLIKAVEKFIFYDDVNFIKNGWINRNRILIQGKPAYFTVQLNQASSFKLIKEIEFLDNRSKLIKTIQMTYAKAPFFDIVFPIVQKCLCYKTRLISNLAINSIYEVSNYLEINTIFEVSSLNYSDTQALDKTERILGICKRSKADTYINAVGGIELYSKEEFLRDNVNLFFLETNDVKYNQFGSEFVPWLSIIDVMMFNAPNKINAMLDDYNLL